MMWEAWLDYKIEHLKEMAYYCIVEEYPLSELPPGAGPGTQDQIATNAVPRDAIDANFGQFRYAHYKSCEHMINKLGEAQLNVMAFIDDNISEVRMGTVGWDDPVGDAYRDYLGQCETAVMWRLYYIEAMRTIAELQRQIIKRTREDVERLTEGLLTALNDYLSSRATASFGLSEAFHLAGAIVTFGVAVADGVPGTELPAGVRALHLAGKVKTAIEAGSEVARNLQGQAPEVRGDNTLAILNSAFDALETVRQGVVGLEEGVIDALGRLEEDIRLGMAGLPSQFDPVEPASIDVNTATPEDVRTIGPEIITRAACEELPPVAAANRTAAEKVGSIESNEPHAFEGDLHGAPAEMWRARRTDLQRVLNETASGLDDMSAKLLQIAQTYFNAQCEQVEVASGIDRALNG